MYAFTAPIDDMKGADIAFFTTKTHVDIFKNKWSSKFVQCTLADTPEQWKKLTQYIQSLEQTH